MVLREFAVWANADDTNAYPGVERLAHNLRMHPNTVYNVRKALVAAGELVETARKGRNGPKVYTVAAVAAANRGLTPQGCEPMGSHQKPVGSHQKPVGSHQKPVGSHRTGRELTPQGVDDLVLPDRKRPEGEGLPSGKGLVSEAEVVQGEVVEPTTTARTSTKWSAA
jgi:hypothetical protein